MYRTFAGQPVDFKFAIVGGTSVKEAETGFMVRASVKREDQQESQELPTCDKGDRSYFFSYQPDTPGLCTLSVTVEGNSVHGSPFTWEVLPNLKSQDELANILYRERGNNKTKQCWKLKYLGSTPGNSKVEIGVNYYDTRGYNYRYTWCRQNNAYTTCRGRNSSGNQASITSLQNDDILSVYLNQTANKLVIYNHRNEQLEAFNTCTAQYSMGTVVITKHLKVVLLLLSSRLNVCVKQHIIYTLMWGRNLFSLLTFTNCIGRRCMLDSFETIAFYQSENFFYS